jgi:hypothetical protein
MGTCRCGIKLHFENGRTRLIEGNRGQPTDAARILGEGSSARRTPPRMAASAREHGGRLPMGIVLGLPRAGLGAHRIGTLQRSDTRAALASRRAEGFGHSKLRLIGETPINVRQQSVR